MKAKTLEEHMEKKFQELSIPEHMQEQIRNYVLRGQPIGGFLGQVFANNLVQAALFAGVDEKNKLYEYAVLLNDSLPKACWGSPDNVLVWRQQGGLYNSKWDDA